MREPLSPAEVTLVNMAYQLREQVNAKTEAEFQTVLSSIMESHGKPKIVIGAKITKDDNGVFLEIPDHKDLSQLELLKSG